MSEIASLWRGHFPLVKTYWLYGVGGLVLLNLVLVAAVAVATSGPPSAAVASLLLLLAFGAVGYVVLVSVAIWRSASNYGGRIVWSAMAKAAVAAGVVSAVASAAGHFGIQL